MPQSTEALVARLATAHAPLLHPTIHIMHCATSAPPFHPAALTGARAAAGNLEVISIPLRKQVNNTGSSPSIPWVTLSFTLPDPELSVALTGDAAGLIPADP